MGFEGSIRRGFFTCLLLGVISFVITSEMSADSPREISASYHLGLIDELQITPAEPMEFSGHPGGPFMPSNIFYQLINTGGGSISWTVTKPSWLDINSSGGNLSTGESFSLRCWPNLSSELLMEGRHSGILRFTVLSTGQEILREINLHIYTEPKLWHEPFSFEIIDRGFRGAK